jgi:putative pyruvate formate lyase activating enzyme
LKGLWIPLEDKFVDQLSNCVCCPRNCGINRLEDKVGFCRIPAKIIISHAGLHFGEEPPISGTKGSGTIFFAGCNLRCVFCQNFQISQEFKLHPSRELTVSELADEMLRLQGMGAHNVNFVSPSHMIFQMADAIVEAKQRGFSLPVVYNTNGYDSVDALKQIRGLVDIYLPDIKYMDDKLGKELSGVSDYSKVIPGVLSEMLDQVGHLQLDGGGIATRGVLVRHLVLPGHLDNSYECMQELADISTDFFISIMSQYSPQYRACDYPVINRKLTSPEYDEITDFALELGLENAFVQELDSQENYLPDFNQEKPFDN